MLKTQSMNLDYIRTFVTLGQVKTISEAVKKLNIDVSNVRRHINAFEELMGAKLFTKNGGVYQFTEDGKKLFDGLEKGYNMLLLAEKDYIQTKSLNSGKLSIGISDTIDRKYIDKILINFKKKYNNVILKIIVLPPNLLFEKLNQFNLDVIIVNSLDNDTRYKSTNIYKEKYTIIYSKDIKDIEELSNYPIILPTSDRNERLNITNLLKNINIKDNLSIEVNDFYSMIEYVKEGLGYAIVPERLVSNDLKTFDIDYEKEVSIYYINDYLSPTAKVFIEEIKNNS